MTYKFTKGYVDENITLEQERDLAIALLHHRCFWLDDTFCVIHSITRNDRHYFITYEDRISTPQVTKQIIIAQLKEVVK